MPRAIFSLHGTRSVIRYVEIRLVIHVHRITFREIVYQDHLQACLERLLQIPARAHLCAECVREDAPDSRRALRNPRTATQTTATYCNILQHTATYCNILQHTATHCNTLRHTATNLGNTRTATQTTATQCNTVQDVAAHCSTLQHTATHLGNPQTAIQTTPTHHNTLQHTWEIHELLAKVVTEFACVVLFAFAPLARNVDERLHSLRLGIRLWGLGFRVRN